MKKIFRCIFYRLVYYSTKIFLLIFVPRRIIGMQNIPPRQGCILACNHLSNLDPPFIGSVIHRQLSFMAKEELFRHRILGFILRNVGTIPIRRNQADFRGLREAIRVLRSNRPVVIFPQGSRQAIRRAANRGDKVFSGIGFLAAKSGVPVIPVTINGSDKVLPVHARWIRRHQVTLVIGRPLYFAQQELYPQIALRIMDAIEALEPAAA